MLIKPRNKVIRKDLVEFLLSYSGAKEIVNIFGQEGVEIRFVGGCVRDALLKIKIKDIDFAVNVLPKEVSKILQKNNIKVVPTGIEHGTVTAFYANNKFEITTTRSDKKCDGRHALVEFSTSFFEDAHRRDFTINAMSLLPDGEFFDYFGGEEDLKHKLIKFVGDPFVRSEEDYLRILRLFRFYSNYGKNIDEQSFAACKKYSKKILKISAERIYSEFIKILVSKNLISTLQLMFQADLLQQILPLAFLKLDRLKKVLATCKKLNIEQNHLRNLIAILYDDTKKIPYWLNFNKEKKLFQEIMKMNLEIASEDITKLLYKHGRELIFEKTILSGKCSNKNVNFILQSEVPVLPIKAIDLIELGIMPSKMLGNYLKQTEDYWIRSDFTAPREELMLFIKGIIVK